MSAKKERNKPTKVSTVEQAYNTIMENREKLLAAWIAATGLRPEETVLVEQRYGDGSNGVFARKKTENDGKRLCPKCGHDLIVEIN